MNKDYVKNLFEEIIKEASIGSVNALFHFGIIFETQINNVKVTESDKNDMLIPVLQIQNYDLFLNYLSLYLEYAKEFYCNDKYLTDSDQTDRDKDKLLLTVLWSNATIDDFSSPINYLRKRIDFFNMPMKNLVKYIPFLNCDLIVEFKKSSVLSETPYEMDCKFTDYENEYYLPSVFLGISDSKAYLYAIQNKYKNESLFSKKINRALYKVNDGFDVNYESRFEESLKDITPSFVMSSNILMGLLKDNNILELITSSMLLVRYDNKVMSTHYDEEKTNLVQNNMTQKLIRTILRAVHHHTGADVVFYPTDVDFDLHVKITLEDTCNNELLRQTYNLNKMNNKSL